ncbi:MAG: bifunctional UDP-N-acetylglucosamine diphosphorylase/glucosamine-1-phosphate N-acetyltransferase GlmU [Oscillospiraceae bacterium]|nr:bifunctional UDP-N-acetylglucosamine diphosphorylase/glucosamine-1-phosphate N-acetyltransferase GlmU [Oscillospiraceae bacterium]
MVNSCAVVLAGGKGTRMRSEFPKTLLEVSGAPMLQWVMDVCKNSRINKTCVVTGYKSDLVEKFLQEKYPDSSTAYQAEQKGTGHALFAARDFIENSGCEDILVLCGDSPLMDADTVTKAYAFHMERNAAATVITAKVENPAGYGRIIREDGMVSAIMEEKELVRSQFGICEINSGAYWFKLKEILGILDEIKNNNTKGEYYLTDAIAILAEKKRNVSAYSTENKNVALGANNCEQLYDLSEIARKMIIKKHLVNGVSFMCTDGVVIAPGVTIGSGTVILPGTQIIGESSVGYNCKIGPNSHLKNIKVGNGSIINATQAYESNIGGNVKIGPFCHLRPGCNIGDNVKIGDFVEVKNTVLGEKTSVAHLSYIGDSDIGKGVNLGCGTFTANYDGVKKFRTVICDKAFIGCNTNLVAPVTVGEGAYTAAGSTITGDVPAGSLAIERNRQVIKSGWADKKLKNKK